MSYFKLFFKVVKRNIGTIILALAIVCILFFLITNSNDPYKVESYNTTIAFFDNDNTEFSNIIKEEISKHSDFVEIENTETSINKAFKKFEINYYIEIPEGFTEKFLNGEEASINTAGVDNSQSGIYLETNINNYLNNAKLYLDNSNEDLSKFYEFLRSEENNDIFELNLSGLKSNEEENKVETDKIAFNFSSYGVSLGILQVVTVFFMQIRKEEIRKRYGLSPVKSSKMLLEIILANIIFVIVYVALYLIVVCIFTKPEFNTIFFMNLLNLFIYSIVILSLALLLGLIIKKSETANAVNTGISLALAFIGGSFVPIQFFGDTIKFIANFVPSYWYGKSVDLINTTGNIDYNTIFQNMGIQMLFAVAIFAITFVVNKQKSRE